MMPFGLPFTGRPRAGASPPPPPWTPTDPGTPALWLDCQTAALWQDTGGTTPASSPGDPVARANVAYGTNLTQATGSARPTRSTIGSAVALLGDASDDRLASTQTIADAAATLAVVYKYGSSLGASVRQILCAMGVAGSKRWTLHTAGASASLPYLSWTLAGGSSTAHVGADVVVGDTARHVLVVKYLGGTVTDTANWRCWVDGAAQTVVTRAALTPAGTTAVLARSDGVTASGAALGELIVWASALSDADCVAASSYLAGRW
jgi:hypothetical protein